jgi:hypothetical protein
MVQQSPAVRIHDDRAAVFGLPVGSTCLAEDAAKKHPPEKF